MQRRGVLIVVQRFRNELGLFVHPHAPKPTSPRSATTTGSSPLGGCRLCVVEVEGQRNPVASCTTVAMAGMKVPTATTALEKHRKTLVELLTSENPHATIDPLRDAASQELATLQRRYGATGQRFVGKTSGSSRKDDPNPIIFRDYDQCISCYRCVRVCAFFPLHFT